MFETEASQLANAGFAVERLVVDNDAIGSRLQAAAIALRPGGMRVVAQRLQEAVARHRAEIVHFHNLFPLIGARALEAVVASGVPAVVTLHNYRLLCANAMLMRDGGPCTLCEDYGRLQGIRYRCYRGSAIGSTAVTLHTEMVKRVIARHPQAVTCIALTDFARAQFVGAGIALNSLRIKGNSVSDLGRSEERPRSGLLYVGRLSAEKGVSTLLAATAQAHVPLTIIGEGPQEAELRASASPDVTFLGRLPGNEVRARMREALAVAIPSIWFEGFPMTAVEAMEAGTAVIASDIGSLSEIVTPNIGMLARPGHVGSLVEAIAYMFSDPAAARAQGQAARSRFERLFAPEANVRTLTAIYQDACAKFP